MSNHFGQIDNIILQDYRDDYPKLFGDEKQILLDILKDEVILIEHIGSSAIKNIKSKPIIDIGLYIKKFPISDDKIELLRQENYIYWDTNPDKTHQFLFKGLPRTHHLHIYPETNEKLKQQILFRNYLRGHSDIAKSYEKLKIDLAQRFYNDREKYTDMKKDFIEAIIEQSNE
jgi:GrpB-like predicted nucleotidyltransferase (UPF0157 family)